MKDRKKTKTNNPRKLFSGTYEYYAKYRPDIPEEVIDVIVEHLGIKPSDRVLDIGCGTGQVALAMEGRCKEVVSLDPDPEMLEWAKKATKDSKTKLIWLNYGAEDLGKIKKRSPIFKLATVCRAFHWMNQDQVLKDLNDLIKEDGGIAILGDKSFWTGNEKWQRVIKKVIQKYLGEERRAGKGKFKKSDELWENIIARSPFKFVKRYDMPIVRTWNIDTIIGCLFSTSFASPPLFGNQLGDFTKDVEKTLLAINPNGSFKDNAVWSIVLASKKSRQITTI